MSLKTIKKLYLVAMMALVLISSSPAYAGFFNPGTNVSFGGKCGSLGNLNLNVSVGSLLSGGVSFGSLLGSVSASASQTLGETICNLFAASDQIPNFLAAIAYLLGLTMGVFGIFKLKDHVLDPRSVPLSDAVKRLLACGAFLALPAIMEMVKTTLVGEKGDPLKYGALKEFSTYSGSGGLETMVGRLIEDLWGPVHVAFLSFGYLAGIVFVMIGINRLMRTAQQGPTGPMGFGTIMTFIIAGVLFSLEAIMGALNTTFFGGGILGSGVGGGNGTIPIVAMITQDTGDLAVNMHISAVITSVVQFMILIGWISFVRGFFILRALSDGSNQASLMAAVTHIIGGALAVNLGPVINAVQSTLGVNGVSFLF